MAQFFRPFFEWCFNTSIGTSIRESTWAFAYIEVFHLLGLTLVLGAIVIVSLRLAGLSMRTLTIREVTRETAPFLLGGMTLVLISGVLMFLSESMKCFDSPPFAYKMGFLFTALICQFTLMRKLTRADDHRYSSLLNTAAAVLSLFLWFGVGVMGRAIGFY